MVRDRLRYVATGGWGYQAWSEGRAARPTVTDMAGECYGCHASAEAIGYVFSRWQP